MKRWYKVLAVSCLCAVFTGGVTAYADLDKSVHSVTLVAAQEDYSNVAVSQVTDYVNIREEPNTDSGIVGKIYNNCAATILETVSGEDGDWYQIQSGSVSGYIKAEYFITGSEAEQLAMEIGREYVTIDTEGLRLRAEPDLNSEILTLLSNGERYLVQGAEGDFFKVEVDADLIGYIAKEYCRTEVEFDQAVSLEEEQQKIDEENQRKKDAEDAIAALEIAKQEAAQAEASGFILANPEESDNSHSTTAPVFEIPSGVTEGTAGSSGSSSDSSSGPGGSSSGSSGSQVTQITEGPGISAASAAVTSATRTAIVAYAKQFLGNPYVYGGTSLTNGTDCSGFTQGVYAHFGITTGRSSRDQAANGKAISITSAQPGDLLFYSSRSSGTINHVAMYIGNGQIIHAGTERTGICIAAYDYRTPCKAVTFLD
ncbi:MAG: C40 family peptidase [Clostridiales bacterium]|nr:C40 family peptidase [Clostridiales bacterium]